MVGVTSSGPLARLDATLVLFESGSRVQDTLVDLRDLDFGAVLRDAFITATATSAKGPAASRCSPMNAVKCRGMV